MSKKIESEDILFSPKELRSLVNKEFIRPLGESLEEIFENNTALNDVIPIQSIHKDYKTECFSMFGEEKEKTRVIFMGYNPETEKLHFIPLNENYNMISIDKLIKYFIAKTPDYLDPFNPLEVLSILPEEGKGLTQMAYQKDASGKKKIIFSEYAQLDSRSYQTTSFDILLGIKRTLYIPIPNPDEHDPYFTENGLGVLLLMSDLKEAESLGGEYSDFGKERNKLLQAFVQKHYDQVEKSGEKLETESEEVTNKSTRIERLINSEFKGVQDLYETNDKIKLGAILLKKLLLQTLFIYNDYINLLDSYICMEAEKTNGLV